MNSGHSTSFFRTIVVAAVILCILITGFSILRYPGILYPLPIGITYLVVLIIVLLSYVIFTVRLTRNSDADSLRLAQRGSSWGLAIAGFWLVEIVAGNLLDPGYRLVKLVYFGSSVFAFSLPIFAGMQAARQTGLIQQGTRVGLWSGIISGLLTFLCLMVITYLFLNTLLQDPQNIVQSGGSGAPDLATFVVGDSLAGATGHLVIGLVLGPAFGTIGGLIGKAFSPQMPKSTT